MSTAEDKAPIDEYAIGAYHHHYHGTPDIPFSEIPNDEKARWFAVGEWHAQALAGKDGQHAIQIGMLESEIARLKKEWQQMRDWATEHRDRADKAEAERDDVRDSLDKVVMSLRLAGYECEHPSSPHASACIQDLYDKWTDERRAKEKAESRLREVAEAAADYAYQQGHDDRGEDIFAPHTRDEAVAHALKAHTGPSASGSDHAGDVASAESPPSGESRDGSTSKIARLEREVVDASMALGAKWRWDDRGLYSEHYKRLGDACNALHAARAEDEGE